jgi:hypothetical protein
MISLDALPGGDVIQTGLQDLAAGRTTDAALLVLIGAHRLRRAGIDVPAVETEDAEHRLYESLASTGSDDAHSRYNAMIRLLVSFERAVECAG